VNLKKFWQQFLTFVHVARMHALPVTKPMVTKHGSKVLGPVHDDNDNYNDDITMSCGQSSANQNQREENDL